MDAKCSRRKTEQARIFSGRSRAGPHPRNIIGEEKTNLNDRVPDRRKPSSNNLHETHRDRDAISYQPLRRQNKCGPGQPPGPHRFCVTFCDPCPRTRHGGVHLSRAPRSAVFDALGRPPLAKRTSQVDLQHHGGRRPVLPCVEDSVRRPQRPGNQSRAEARSWRIPPSHSPSRIAGHRRLCRNALAGHTERLARCQHCAPAPVFASSKNPVPFVKKLWMPAIPCGSSWKIRTVFSIFFSKDAPAEDRPPGSRLRQSLRDNGASVSRRIRARDAGTPCPGRT